MNQPTTPAVRRRMQRQRTLDTQPELRLRSQLHKLGLRFRLGISIPEIGRGKIDIAFPGAKVAVFVDGCFWHGCSSHKSIPRNNREFWEAKIDATRRRDERMSAALTSHGWKVVRVWEHEDEIAAAKRIARLVRRRSL